jgi:hypothetical protein
MTAHEQMAAMRAAVQAELPALAREVVALSNQGFYEGGRFRDLARSLTELPEDQRLNIVIGEIKRAALDVAASSSTRAEACRVSAAGCLHKEEGCPVRHMDCATRGCLRLEQPADRTTLEVVGWLHEVVWEDGTSYSHHRREPKPLDPTPGLLSQRIGRAAILAADGKAKE